MFKEFKSNSDVASIITNEIPDTVIVKKEGRTTYAVQKETNELFN